MIVQYQAETHDLISIETTIAGGRHAAGGDPDRIFNPPRLGRSGRTADAPVATPKQVEDMRRTLGLDKPLYIQYALFIKNAAHGNLGVSYHHGQPALKLVVERLPASLELVFTSMMISLVLAVPIGVLAASKRGTWFDRGALIGSILGISAPPFWIGIAFILIFAVILQWLPSSGRGTWLHLILPATSLALYRLALFIRLIRAGMLDIMTQDFIRTARSKGVAEKTVIYKHALKNTLIPFVTIAGMQMGSLLAGAIVTEKVFAWPAWAVCSSTPSA